MKIIHSPSELGPVRRKVCLAIGFFDGVHLGHQQIIRQTTSDARQHEALALILTFDRHPNAVIAPDRAPPLIYPLDQKLRVIELLGVDATLVLHFDKELSERSGEEFIRTLAAQAGPIRSICVGANFVFGHKRSGNVGLLRRLGAELNFAVHGHAAVSLDGKAVSSTRIRQAIGAGHLDGASQMLGRPYSLVGEVVLRGSIRAQIGFSHRQPRCDRAGASTLRGLCGAGQECGRASPSGGQYRSSAHVENCARPGAGRSSPAWLFGRSLWDHFGISVAGEITRREKVSRRSPSCAIKSPGISPRQRRSFRW